MADNTSEIKIVVNGDGSNATKTLNGIKDLLSKGVVGALDGVRSAVNKVMGALGLFGLAMHGVQTVIEGYRRLTEWMHRAAKAAGELRLAAVMNDAARAMDRLVSRQEAYNRLLKEELSDLGRRRELRDIEADGDERREAERREIARAKELAGASDEDEERAIRQRWAVEDETRERGGRYRQLQSSAAEDDERAAIYGAKAGAAERSAADAARAADELRAEMARMSAAQLADAEKSHAALEKKRKALEEEARLYRTEERQAESRAGLYRRQAEDALRGGGVAQARNDAENAKIAEKDFERRQREARESSDAAQEFVAAALEEEERRKEERQARVGAYYGGLAGQLDAGRPRDRLTAMGLGSGGAADRTAQEQAADVKTLVQLLKEQVSLTREGKHGDVAVYAP